MYCLAYSEPDHGSDLAAIETRAEVRGNDCFVTGVKTWVAGADRATHAVVLCRTGHGLASVLVPLDDNGVEVQPIRTLAGEDTLFQVVFEGSRGQPVDSGEFDSSPSPWLDAEAEFWDLVDTARRCGRSNDSHIRQQLAWAYAQIRVIRALADRDVALARLMWSEFHRRFGEIAMEIVGADGLVRPDAEAYTTSRWQRVFLTSRGDTIAAGTTEIQRITIAEDLLGLPR